MRKKVTAIVLALSLLGGGTALAQDAEGPADTTCRGIEAELTNSDTMF